MDDGRGLDPKFTYLLYKYKKRTKTEGSALARRELEFVNRRALEFVNRRALECHVNVRSYSPS